MGARGMHWEISRQEIQEYPLYNRASTRWWEVASFCKDGIKPPPGVAEAMPTAERVERFGNDRIQGIYAGMLLDDFQQEYECLYVDETVSFFTWETIRLNQDENLICYHVTEARGLDTVLQEMRRQITDAHIENVFVGGMDVGRTRNLSEIMLVGAGSASPVRLMVSLEKSPFDEQEHVVRTILEALPVSAFLIDRNGIGMHLAENLEYDTCAQGVDFTNQSKALWATRLNIEMTRGQVPIPPDRDLAYQIHSIKKTITAAKNTVYDTDANERHHADKTWALALAVWANHEEQDAPEWGTTPGWRRR